MSSTHAAQMTLFSVPEPEPPKPEPPQPVGWGETVVVDPGPIGCSRSRCREHGAYLVGSRVLCEKHAVQAVWDEIGGKNAGNKNPYTTHCADGFRAVRHRGREDHRSLGEHQRVQICRSRRCKAVFAVHWLATGEPTLCPACRNAALREILGQTQAIL